MNRSKLFAVSLVASTVFLSAVTFGQPISYDQKKTDINSLKAYEKENGSPSQYPQQAEQKADTEFICDSTSEHNCELQETLDRIANRQEPTFISNGNFKVDLFFVNDGNFPFRYMEKNHFESISKEQEPDTLKQIFEHYLGDDADSYSPKIINVSESAVGITVLVSTGSALDVFLDDSRIVGIYHIGNNRVVEEDY